MLEAPTIYCEIVVEMWSSAIFDSGNKVLKFDVKGVSYSFNNDAMFGCFNLPENNYLNGPVPNIIVNMLNFDGLYIRY